MSAPSPRPASQLPLRPLPQADLQRSAIRALPGNIGVL